ncbi:hypothetical protein GCM10009845_20780 [Pedococcus bigeumensis]
MDGAVGTRDEARGIGRAPRHSEADDGGDSDDGGALGNPHGDLSPWHDMRNGRSEKEPGGSTPDNSPAQKGIGSGVPSDPSTVTSMIRCLRLRGSFVVS